MTQTFFELEHHGLMIRGTQYLPVMSQWSMQRVPAVILLHGFAGHRIGPSGMFVQIARALCAQGIAAVTFDLRNNGESDGSFDQALVSEQLADTLHVTQWVQRQPWIDRSRLGVYGFSLGGLLAGCANGKSDAYKAFVLAAPTTVENMCRHAASAKDGDRVVVGPTPLHGDFFEDVRKLDPVAGMTRGKRPTLIVQGDADTAVPREVSQVYADALRMSGAESELKIVPGAEHSFGSPQTREALITATTDWFTRWL